MPTVTASDSLAQFAETATVRGDINITPAPAFAAGHVANPYLPTLVVAAGLDSVYRITSWDATIGDDGVSHLSLTLGIPPPTKPGVPSNLYLMQMLTDLQNQVSALSTSSYGSGHAYATVVVAAVNSRSINADFVCVGFTDEQTINLAIAALPKDGYGDPFGKLVLLEGRYNTATSVVVNGSAIEIEGMSAGSDSANGTVIVGLDTGTAADDYELLIIEGSPPPSSLVGAGAEVHHIGFISYANSSRAGLDLGMIGVHKYGASATIHDCVFAPGVRGGSSAADCTQNAYAVLVGQDPTIVSGDNGCYAPMLYQNFVNGSAGFRFYNAEGAMVFANQFDGSSSGIEFFDGFSDISVVGNFFDGGNAGGFNTPSLVPARPAIYCEGGGIDAVVSGNYLLSNGGPGVLIDGCSQVTVTGNNLYTYFSQIPDDSKWAFPLRGDPKVRVGSHGVAVRWTRTTTDTYRGPITITGNDMSYSVSMVNVLVGFEAGTPSADPLIALVIHGNTCVQGGVENFAGQTFEPVPAILIDGGAAGVIAAVVRDNLLGLQTANGSVVDAIRLLNGVSYSSIGGNHIDIHYYGAGGSFSWGPEATGPWPINIATPDCLHNFVTGNYAAPGYIRDNGTGTVVTGNLVSPSYLLDGGSTIFAAGTGTGSAVQDGGVNQAGGDNSIAEGYGADAYEQGQVAHAATVLSHAGDAQASEVTAAVITTTATPTALANQAGARLVEFPDWSRTVEFEIVIVARQTG